ncbi:ECF RNA polymerase sigma factor SigR [Methylobacterium radiotolerans]|nr:ECF RNA polymerase sigma factor SigR [Methylobacterium radiotolerans]
MSTCPEAPSQPAADPKEATQAVLPEQIRRRLGSLLAAAYAQEDAELDAAEHFADVLAKLDTALGKARSRDEADFQKQLLAVGPSLRRFAISLTHDVTEADDLVQETLLRGWRNRAHFQPGTNLEAWTFTILRNHFYSERRKRREVQDDDGSYAARLVSLPDQGGRLELQDVQAALSRIPEVMREALMLVTVSDLPYEEVAEIMGCQLGTVKSRVWRARDLLARALGYAGAEIGTDSVMLSALAGTSQVRG